MGGRGVPSSCQADLRVQSAYFLEVCPSPAALSSGTQGMVFDEMEALAASRMMGPKCHGEVAHKLEQVLKDII